MSYMGMSTERWLSLWCWMTGDSFPSLSSTMSGLQRFEWRKNDYDFTRLYSFILLHGHNDVVPHFFGSYFADNIKINICEL